jgi:hypothetical protein
MLLYKITYQKNYDGVVSDKSVWAGSKSDAGSLRKKIRQEHGYMPNSVQTSKIDVPTKKTDLIKFLNSGILSQ